MELTTQTSKWLTLAQVAELTSLSQKTIRRRVASGALKAYRTGQAYRFKPSDVDRMMQPVVIPGGAK